jgi:arsenate reductase
VEAAVNLLNSPSMYHSIKSYCKKLENGFEKISEERKTKLNQITDYIRSKGLQQRPIHVIYICTHNSRRSHLGQIWAKVASVYYNIDHVSTFSGGTEKTAFNGNAVSALIRCGFKIKAKSDSENPIHEVFYSDSNAPIRCFSKLYNDPHNPAKEFAAIMTCEEAEQNCPFIPEAELRISTPYEDPKAYDNTSQQDRMYDERCRQIALETLYVFSKVK